MLNKLAFRNAKRASKDYLIYIVTMILVSGLMFAFNSMIFSKDVRALCSMAGMMEVMIGLASIFIIFIVSWLINYMITFMMEKRSREFGTYLLLGMKKKEVANVYMRENSLLGLVAFFPGIFLGLILQQILTACFYTIFEKNYKITIKFNLFAFLLSFCIYAFIFFIALQRNKRRLKRLTISDFMRMDKKNEQYVDKNTKLKQQLFFVSILYYFFFAFMLFAGKIELKNVFFLILGLIVCTYMLYSGVAAFVVETIKRRKRENYKEGRLFLLRQFSSKIKSMHFTLGTLTILFTAALIGSTVTMMLSDANNKILKNTLPFDITMFKDEVNYDFKAQLEIIQNETNVLDSFIYHVYEDQSEEMNQYIYNNYIYFESGVLSKDKRENRDANEYFDYDTYLSLSDYNHLRKMLGYEEVELSSNGYIIHAKERILSIVKDFSESQILHRADFDLTCEGVYSEALAQSGINGADYVFVVPDDIASKLTPYYSLLAVDIEGESPEGLQSKLEATNEYYDDLGNMHCNITWGFGTDQILTCASQTLVKTNLEKEMKFVTTVVAYPLTYIALVFIFVALTILSVQQLSDSNKYKFRYSVLSKLGFSASKIDKLIFKQLFVYFICPLIASLTLSGMISLYMSERFVFYTGIQSQVYQYYGATVGTFLIGYIIYFLITYVGFKRNVNE